MKSTLRSFAYALAFVFFSSSSLAQTFSGTGGIINDDNTLSDFVIEVDGLTPDILTPDHGLVNVCINVIHTWDADLDIRLIAPDGTNIMLSSSLGADGDNYENTCFDMFASEHIINGFAPFTSGFKPFTPLGNVNNGSSGNGRWTLRIFDLFPYADIGSLVSWNITFGNGAPEPVRFDSSSFPIILLTTDNVTVPNEPKVPGKIKVVDNGNGNFNHITDVPVYEGFMGIEVRGASSQSFPKKNFGLETQDSLGADFAIALLGLPAEEDWILYAPYTDKSFIRDALTYKLGNDQGRYAPHTRFIELFLNGDYQGVYCLEEKIKRDKNRVDIAKLNPADTLGDQVTGGYIIKVDRDDGDGTYFVSNYFGTDQVNEVRIVYEDPKGQDLHPLQKAYIQDFFHGFEAALYGANFTDEHIGYRKYVDVPSLVDFFLINEFGHNVDAYRLSTFMYKDRNSKDSLFHFGPLWDFNLAFGNVDYCSSNNLEGWAYDDSGACGNTPLWWPRFLKDTLLQDQIQCRYKSLRENVLSNENIMHYVDSMALTFALAESRNYDRWPILGIYIWPNNFIGQTYEEEINYMKDWIIGRLAWMDENIPGECVAVGTNDLDEDHFSVIPNPANQFIRVSSAFNQDFRGDVFISDITGSIRLTEEIDANGAFDVSSLSAGTYIITLKNDQGKMLREKFVVVR
ncbi:MAG TPA: CotH kinase family protein [Saprospiraceae bacterium]|nr:CotH kinase family protein [Saprospiraceae bacterium]